MPTLPAICAKVYALTRSLTTRRCTRGSRSISSRTSAEKSAAAGGSSAAMSGRVQFSPQARRAASRTAQPKRRLRNAPISGHGRVRSSAANPRRARPATASCTRSSTGTRGRHPTLSRAAARASCRADQGCPTVVRHHARESSPGGSCRSRATRSLRSLMTDSPMRRTRQKDTILRRERAEAAELLRAGKCGRVAHLLPVVMPAWHRAGRSRTSRGIAPPGWCSNVDGEGKSDRVGNAVC
jgi:hypothetical protein